MTCETQTETMTAEDVSAIQTRMASGETMTAREQRGLLDYIASLAARVPGLLEAVGPMAEYVRHALEMRGKEAPRPFPAKEARALLAAYDVAKGGSR